MLLNNESGKQVHVASSHGEQHFVYLHFRIKLITSTVPRGIVSNIPFPRMSPFSEIPYSPKIP
uniref:Ovule protein n=1 Tax=Romanomermis culicivorax TaxID=13658 RepID=A0A915HW17_ROMCU